MSALHIDFIVGSHNSPLNEDKAEQVVELHPLPQKTELLSDAIMEGSLNSEESLAVESKEEGH